MNNQDDELDIFYNQKSKPTQVIHAEKKQRITSAKNISVKSEQPPLKTVPMISMKAFIFNFKKFYKEKTKIRNLLSGASAKQRNISLKIYLRNHFSSYKEIKMMLLQTKIQEVRLLQRFEELAFQNVAEQKDTRIYVRGNQTDKIATMCREALQELFMQKESAFYEKRVIAKYLNTIYSDEKYVPIGYPELSNKHKDAQLLSSLQIQTVGQFIQGISKVVQKQFKLVDVAHYLYEHKYRRSDVDIIMQFMNKVKIFYNNTQGKQKLEPIDGDRPLSFDLITTQFNILTYKEQTNNGLVMDLLTNIRKLINNQIKVDTVDRVRLVMEHNIVGDYLSRYFKELDDQISNQLSYIDQISNLVYNIDKFNLETKQDQLEVLLGYIRNVQNQQMDEDTAIIAQKHSNILSELLSQFEKTIEEAAIKPPKKIDPNFGIPMPAVKKVLYEDDLREQSEVSGGEFANPYKVSTADLPIRKAKILNIGQIKPQPSEINNIQELQEAEEYLNHLIDNEYDKQELICSQVKDKLDNKSLSKEEQNIRMGSIDRDLLYEQEFEKLKKSSKAATKEEMIMELQKQIQELRNQVIQQKKQ